MESLDTTYHDVGPNGLALLGEKGVQAFSLGFIIAEGLAGGRARAVSGAADEVAAGEAGQSARSIADVGPARHNGVRSGAAVRPRNSRSSRAAAAAARSRGRTRAPSRRVA